LENVGNVGTNIRDLDAPTGEDRLEAAGQDWFVGCDNNAH
jgi:hypothetical protein